ncbi:lumazine binding domain-containing protein [Elsinoe australis]|uniref:Riboflavin synthase n=1 Tax=Elsinoe australis TaxID=40998 RepID=A0A2P8A5J5_9PEZI|nr:Riboflavin synthase [Elsinoe australis]TKX25563.1 lumazine binding domain-containing protein [Elsinoe australis]
MFTGIVETIGTVSALTPQDQTSSGGGGTSLTISDCADILVDAHLGDSISVNGTCLTVTEFNKNEFKVGVAPETLNRTNLGALQRLGRVNLERAVSAETRMGGHFVQGHVDTVASIVSINEDGNSLRIRFRPREKNVLRYIIEKGYVTLDGASLTITAVEDGEDGWFEVMLVAYTQSKIVLSTKKEGELVNVEVDMVGKYVEKAVSSYFETKHGEDPAVLQRMVKKLVDERLNSTLRRF